MKNPFVVLLVGLIFTAGCGGGSSSSTSGPAPTGIALNPSATQQIDEGQSVNFNAVLAPSSASQAVSWALGGPGALSNQTPTAVTYTAPSSVAAGTATVTATASQATSLTASTTIQFQPLPAITTASLPPATEGAVYDQTIAATGGTGTLTFSLVGSTSLPTGLSMDSTGHISGLPTGPSGTTNFTVAVTDSSTAGAQTATKNLSITVNLASAPTISPATLPNGNVGTPYYQTLTVSGGLGPYNWGVVSGSLPSGLSLTKANLTGSTATISGIPSLIQSNVTFAIQVTDSSVPPQTPTQDYTVSIGAALPLSITTTSLPQAALATPYTASISAQGGTGPYTFTLDATSGSLPPGLSFSSVNNQGVISGTPTTLGTYSNIIVDVTDSASTPATAQQTFSLTVTTQTLSISPASLPAGTVGVAYSQTITAVGGTSPYTFSLDPASNPPPPGLTFTGGAGQATISGTPTTKGTYNGILVDVQDSASPADTAQKSYSITVYTPTTACGAGNESVLAGPYAFLLQGFDAQGPVGIAGSFTADGTGNITVGVEDINRSSGVSLDLPLTTASSSYSVGSDNRGCLTIASSAGTETFRFSLGSIASGVAGKGHIVEFDSSGTNTVGVIAKQDPTAFSNAKISGGYAFGGSTALAGGGKAGIAGQFTASGGNITAGTMDLNIGGAPQSLTSVSGNYDVTDATNGRGTMTLTSLATPINVSIYVVSSQEIFFLSTDTQSVNIPLAGIMRLQTGTPFSVSSLSGTAVVSAEGLGTTLGTSQVQLGLLKSDGAGNFSFSFDKNDGGNVSASPTIKGTYSVGSNARVTLTSSGTILPVLYLYAQNEGFLVDTTGAVLTGAIDPQATGQFTNASLSGNYSFGDASPVLNTTTLTAGVATADGAGKLSETTDLNADGTLAGGQAFSTTYSVSSNGRAILGSNADILYIISPTKAVYMPIASGITNPNITSLEQ